MLKIRFQRVGKKNQPFFRIVVTDKNSPPQGGKFEKVGFFNPLTKEKGLKAERINYWLSVGAQPTDRVYNLLIEEKILEGQKKAVHSRKKKSEDKEEAPVEKTEKTKVETETKPEAKTEIKTEVKKETKTETKTEAKAEVETEASKEPVNLGKTESVTKEKKTETTKEKPKETLEKESQSSPAEKA